MPRTFDFSATILNPHEVVTRARTFHGSCRESPGERMMARRDGADVAPPTNLIADRVHSGMVLRRGWAPGPILTHNGTNTLWFAVVWMSPARDWVMAAITNEGGTGVRRGDWNPDG